MMPLTALRLPVSTAASCGGPVRQDALVERLTSLCILACFKKLACGVPGLVIRMC